MDSSIQSIMHLRGRNTHNFNGSDMDALTPKHLTRHISSVLEQLLRSLPALQCQLIHAGRKSWLLDTSQTNEHGDNGFRCHTQTERFASIRTPILSGLGRGLLPGSEVLSAGSTWSARGVLSLVSRHTRPRSDALRNFKYRYENQ